MRQFAWVEGEEIPSLEKENYSAFGAPARSAGEGDQLAEN